MFKVLETTHRVSVVLVVVVDVRVVVVDVQVVGVVAIVLRRRPKVGVVAQIVELLVVAIVVASRESGTTSRLNAVAIKRLRKAAIVKQIQLTMQDSTTVFLLALIQSVL